MESAEASKQQTASITQTIPQQAFQDRSSAHLHDPTITSTEMDIDSRMPPPSGHENIPQMDADHQQNAGKASRNGIYTIEEWDLLYPIPLPKPTTDESSANTIPLPSVQLTGETVAKAHHLFQIHDMVPTWTFQEVAKGCFTCKVAFGPHTCEEESIFPSKRQAKDAVAQKVITVLQNLKAPPKQKRKLQDVSSDEQDMGPGLNDENWVSRLTEFTQKMQSPPAHFQSFETSTIAQQKAGLTLNPKKYACTAQLSIFPGEIFGSKSSFFSSKAEAKRAAARDAVLWLRANGHLPRMEVVDTASSKRRMSTANDEHTGLTQSISKLKATQSVAQIVADLSIRLGFSQPRYEMTPCAASAESPVGRGFYTASAHYSDQDVRREPRLRGALCETNAVFGQKGAKEMCCRDLAGLLECILRERESEAKMNR